MRFLIRLLCVFLLAAVPAAPALATGNPRSGPAGEIAAPAPKPSGLGLGLGLRLLDIPAALKDDPRARSYIVDRVGPGTEISRRLRVENNTGARQTVRVYAGAAEIKEGSFTGDNPESQSDLTRWTAVDPQELELAPGEATDFRSTITVPADAVEGERYGAVWAEMRNTASGGGVTTVNRVGVRIYLSVGPGGGKAADFTITSISAARDAAGNAELNALVTNSGGRALDITGDVRLAGGPGGLSAGPLELKKPVTLAPGDAREVAFAVPREIPSGPWKASISLKSGLLERQAQAQITFPDAVAVVEAVPEPEFPWWLLAVVVVVLALLAWFLLDRRLRNRNRLAAEEPAVAHREDTGVPV